MTRMTPMNMLLTDASDEARSTVASGCGQPSPFKLTISMPTDSALDVEVWDWWLCH